MKKIVGWAMIAIPFIAIAVWGALSVGVWKIAAIFGAVMLMFAWIFMAVNLTGK